jgi:hypothetical protein
LPRAAEAEINRLPKGSISNKGEKIMNIRNKIIGVLALSLTIIAVTAAIAIGTRPPSVSANTAETLRVRSTLYGIHNLEHNQTARVTVVNNVLRVPPAPGTTNTADPPDPGHARRVTIAFDIYEQAADGSVRFVRTRSRNFTLQGGESATFEHEVDRPRGELVSPASFSARFNQAETLRPSEVVSTFTIERNGNTIATLPGVIRGFNPQPDPPVEDN